MQLPDQALVQDNTQKIASSPTPEKCLVRSDAITTHQTKFLAADKLISKRQQQEQS